MCGLFGIVDPRRGTLDETLVTELFSLLRHRGPDDRGWLALDGGEIRRGSEPADLAGEVVLLHTRLSILDLSAAGHQPMSTPDGRYHLSFNGEIYNYLELRRELESLGRRFVSGSDTEVLLAAYAQWGVAALERLVGMFAFALLDTERRVLVLGRDHFGIKPLFYADLPGGGFAFASEIPPLLELPGVDRQANPQRIYDYLRFRRLDHGAETMFAAIRQLQPAHYLELQLDRPQRSVEKPYWRLEGQPLDGLSLEEAAEGLRELFLDSVRLHLRSDVPVGAAFSGGIDSSANVAAMRRLSGDDLELHTFSYIPDDPALSEERWISLLAHQAGAITHTVTPDPDDLQADLDRLIAVQGEPFNGTSIYAQYRVFQLAHQADIKVMLDGQGADELFAGYRGYLPARLAALLRHGRVVTATRFIQALASLPDTKREVVFRESVKAAVPGALRGWARRATGRLSVPGWLDLQWFEDRDVELEDPRRTLDTGSLREDRLDSVRTNLRTLLRHEDRNSMAWSIESRVPFLTPVLAEFALGLPDRYLIDADGTGKLVLRHSLRELVPDPILDRRDKIGFATPQTSWLLELGPWIDGILGSETARARGPLDTSQVQRRWQATRAGAQEADPATWSWINLIRWIDRFEVTLD
jgi:asparagine synthase (glutamine-hydrolysing)